MKLRITIDVEVNDESLLRTYYEGMHGDILQREPVTMSAIAHDILHARCSGGAYNLRVASKQTHVEVVE